MSAHEGTPMVESWDVMVMTRDSSGTINCASPAPLPDKIGSALEAIPEPAATRRFASQHHHLRRPAAAP
jgi:hypothetical protein